MDRVVIADVVVVVAAAVAVVVASMDNAEDNTDMDVVGVVGGGGGGGGVEGGPADMGHGEQHAVRVGAVHGAVGAVDRLGRMGEGMHPPW